MTKLINTENPVKLMEIAEESPIIEQKKFLENLLLNSEREELHYLDFRDYLEDEPEKFRKRVFYLCLRGLREGILDLLEINRLSEISEIAYHEGYRYSPIKGAIQKTFKKIGEINPIEGRIKNRLLKDPIVHKYLAWNEEVFESNCEDIASSVSAHYISLLREKEIKALKLNNISMPD